jgi:F-type H+-transporting ATPase subunit b
MNLIYLAAQAAEEAAHEPGVFNIDLGVSAWTFIIFVILMIVLGKFAFPPILGYAAAREKRIQDTLDQARRHQEQTERLLEEQRQQLEAARQQAQQMITEGKAGAERVRNEMLAQARVDQEELLQRARRDIESQRDLAVESLRREAIELAIAAAGKVIGERVDSARDRELVSRYLNSVSGSAGTAAGSSDAGAA